MIQKQPRFKLKCFAILLFIFLSVFLLISVVFAESESPIKILEQTAGQAGLGKETNIATIVGNIIKIVLGLISVILVVLFIAGGFMWMTSAGNPDKVKKAKDIIQNALIGAVIVVIAYSLTQFVLSKLVEIVKK